MGINYVENRDGNRHIIWMGLLAFFLLCLLVPSGVAYVGIRLIAPGAESAKHVALFLGFFLGVRIFVNSVALSLRMPIDKLPIPKNG
jgi:hypothetical protein